MGASLETLVIAAYVFADSLSIPRPGPAGKVTDQELIALAVAQAVTGLASDRQFLGRSGGCCRGSFRSCPASRSSTAACRRLTPQIARCSCGSPSWSPRQGAARRRNADRCANYPAARRAAPSPDTPPTATAPPRAASYWGMRLVLICDPKGVPVGYDLRPANREEREGAWSSPPRTPAAHCSPTAGFAGECHDASS